MRRHQSVGLVRVLELKLVALFALVAVSNRLGVKPQLLEAGVPLLVLALHHQVLHAVDETEMHVQIRPGVDGASFHGVEQALVRAMLAGDVAVGSDAGVAVGDEAEVHGVDEPVLEDPREAVHDEPRAVGAQRLVVEPQGDLRRRLRQEGAGGEEDEHGRQEE